MLLSIQQRFILDTLRKLGCVRREQLLILTREKFRRSDLVISEARMEAMLRQLRGGTGDLRVEGDLVSLSRAPPDACKLEAIDVMLELTGGTPLDFSARLRPPVLLQFTWEQPSGAVRPLTVAALPSMEPERSERLEQYQRSRVIWLLEGDGLPAGLALPPKHFIAVRSPDGTHGFYGDNRP